jgi:hypothetical protein
VHETSVQPAVGPNYLTISSANDGWAGLTNSPPSVPGVASCSSAPPNGPVEEIIADIWATFLQVDEVGSEDDFFELSNAFDNEIPYDLMLETGTPTVAGVAAVIESRLVGGGPAALPEVEPAHRTAEIIDHCSSATSGVQQFPLSSLDESEVAGLLARLGGEGA